MQVCVCVYVGFLHTCVQLCVVCRMQRGMWGGGMVYSVRVREDKGRSQGPLSTSHLLGQLGDIAE